MRTISIIICLSLFFAENAIAQRQKFFRTQLFEDFTCRPRSAQKVRHFKRRLIEICGRGTMPFGPYLLAHVANV